MSSPVLDSGDKIYSLNSRNSVYLGAQVIKQISAPIVTKELTSVDEAE